MGIQFILGIWAKRNRGSNPADSRNSGPVGENIGELFASSGMDAANLGRLEFALQTAFVVLITLKRLIR
jgi:hypothetical protein